jgi:hypothetical protein
MSSPLTQNHEASHEMFGQRRYFVTCLGLEGAGYS